MVKPNKPIDIWLALGAVVVGVLFYWIEKTPVTLVGSLLLILVLMIHPIWNFWWIEKTYGRRICVISLFIVLLIIFGYVYWPSRVQEKAGLIKGGRYDKNGQLIGNDATARVTDTESKTQTGQGQGKIPSEKKDTSLSGVIKSHPAIDDVIKGLKSCKDLSPEAQIVCVKEDARIKLVAMAMKDPKFTKEDIMKLMQQPTLSDMKRQYETLTLGAVASISSDAYVISVPPEVASVYLFLQKADTLENGSSEFLGSINREEFLKNVSQYEAIAKSKHMKLILRASTKDQKQWLQNQIKYNQEPLKKSRFRDPSTHEISEGVEWPVN
jgi:hypothetical protein